MIAAAAVDRGATDAAGDTRNDATGAPHPPLPSQDVQLEGYGPRPAPRGEEGPRKRSD
jgi:hypothetical protein